MFMIKVNKYIEFLVFQIISVNKLNRVLLNLIINVLFDVFQYNRLEDLQKLIQILTDLNLINSKDILVSDLILYLNTINNILSKEYDQYFFNHNIVNMNNKYLELNEVFFLKYYKICLEYYNYSI